MRRKSLLLLIISAVLVMQGCSFPQSYPIEGTQNILIAGIDIEGDYIVLTAYVDTISPSAKPGEEQISYKLYTSKGKTLFEADKLLHEYAEKRPSWSHAKYIIIGEDAAKAGIDRLLSFFTEDDETRLLLRVVIAKGTSAKNFLQQASARKGSLADYLDSLFGEVQRTGYSREIHVLNYAINRETPWESVYIPTVELYANPVQNADSQSSQSEPKGSAQGGETKPEIMIILNGFALFDGEKLAGFLDSDLARALNIIRNDLKGSQVTVNDKEGHSVSLEVMKCSSSLDTSFYPLSATVNVSIDSNLVEFHDCVDPMDEQAISYLEQQQASIIKNQIERAIIYMQQKNCDSAYLGDAFYHKDPVKWQEIKDSWKKLFPGLEISVKVESRIRSLYELIEPVS